MRSEYHQKLIDERDRLERLAPPLKLADEMRLHSLDRQLEQERDTTWSEIIAATEALRAALRHLEDLIVAKRNGR